MQQGKAIIFSAPSGSGKTTIVHHLVNTFPAKLGFSISATTRTKRDNETHGKDYYFLTQEEFKGHVQQNDFVEYEEVYAGTVYGTLKQEVERVWANGKAVIFDVDVKGALRLKQYFGENSLAVFVKVPNVETLAERLDDRNTETADSLKTRLAKAEYEMSFEPRFDTSLLNDELEGCLQRAETMVTDFLDA